MEKTPRRFAWLTAYKKLFWPISIQRPWLLWCGVALLVVGVFIAAVDFVHTNHEEVNAFSTIAIAVFNGILSLFTILLAGSTRIAANAAKDAANAAKAQADIARQSLTDLERPYIFIFGVGKIRPSTTYDAFF